MSRVGRAPVAIPAGVTVDVKEGVMTVKGPKGTLTQDIDPQIAVAVEGGNATLTRANDTKELRAKHGLYRALLHNMVVGVTNGYTKSLVINGVGYKVAKQGNKIVLNVGYSHPIEFAEIEGIKLDCPTQTEISVSGIDKVKVGQVAANIRSIREPEPYHGYGIRYKDEVIERKEGKTAGK
ncbi:MAG TPA: 50S ribosomal protein L6 [Candidatus Borkfalkia avistercoris]|uniref:Large ribosomal subunit protein uL6 n=1 Tax=Candidatus Borkfalkia avistercoris TaxID=2838504 RepID=A0A9D2CYS9_9FIRM|nr:50S ribosomal protein L6 [Candidatus Borkfalkia avistercoris]